MKTIQEQIKEKEAELAALKEQQEKLSADYTRFKTFDDCCKDQNVDPNDPKFLYIKCENIEVDNSVPAFERLKVIRNALLGGKKLEWGEGTGYKYFPWFNLTKTPGSGFYSSDFSTWRVESGVSSRLALDSSEKAIYFGSQFENDWYEYMVEHKH